MSDFKQIQQLWNDRETILIEKDTCFINDFKEIDRESLIYSSDTLYICNSPEQLLDSSITPNVHFLYLVSIDDDFDFIKERLSHINNILIVKGLSIDIASADLNTYFRNRNFLSSFSNTLLTLLASNSTLQEIIDASYPFFENCVYVFDPNFRLQAANFEAGMHTESGKKIIENGGFSEEEFKIINVEQTHKKVRQSHNPVQIYREQLGFNQLICNIDDVKDMGHIVLSETNHPFGPLDPKLLMILKAAIHELTIKNQFVRDTKGFPYEYFLKDLLNSKILMNEKSLNDFQYTNKVFSGSLYCLVIETAKSMQILDNQHIRFLFENLIPNTKSLLYNSQIIIIFELSRKEILSQNDFSEINKICIDNDLYVGISNRFTNILQLQDYYKQALRSIELRNMQENVPGASIYANYSVEHIVSVFTKSENPYIFSHPDMKNLIDYDKEHDTQLSYILYMYLLHERNITATASALYLHRNSLQSRLKTINSLIHVDLEDSTQRQYLILSYKSMTWGN